MQEDFLLDSNDLLWIIGYVEFSTFFRWRIFPRENAWFHWIVWLEFFSYEWICKSIMAWTINSRRSSVVMNHSWSEVNCPSMICWKKSFTNFNCLLFERKSKNGSSWTKRADEEYWSISSINRSSISFSLTANERYKRWQARENYAEKNNRVKFDGENHIYQDWSKIDIGLKSNPLSLIEKRTIMIE